VLATLLGAELLERGTEELDKGVDEGVLDGLLEGTAELEVTTEGTPKT
jgi:hypothetical protein